MEGQGDDGSGGDDHVADDDVMVGPVARCSPAAQYAVEALAGHITLLGHPQGLEVAGTQGALLANRRVVPPGCRFGREM